MNDPGYLQYAVLLLLAAVVLVPIARRWRLGAVLGYLAAGALIGPAGLGLIGNTDQISQLSELGVVLMLFVIGIEVSPQRLWVMRRQVFGIGILQMLITAALIGLAAWGLGLIGWRTALIVGLGLALSSTAIDLQTLAERKELVTPHGRLAFAILLFQDVAAIPILALIPVLAANHPSSGMDADVLAGLRVILTLAVVVIGGRYLLRPLFRAAAGTHIPEVFTASALLVVIGTAWLMQLAGISMALGAFLAGVLLADSEYRHEIESQIEPFKGLLLGLFFISVGMSVDLHAVIAQPLLVGGLLVALLAIKSVLLFGIGRGPGRLDTPQALALAAVLAQGGEFSFVVFNLARDNALLAAPQRDLLVLVVTLSMAATPLLVLARARWVKPIKTRTERAWDTIDTEQPRVIIAGFGRVGQIVARILHAHRIAFTALDTDPDQVDFVRRFGNTVFYGDATRLELLRAAGADKAEVFVIATSDPESNLRAARLLKRHFPHLKVYARARNRQHVFKLMDLNIDQIVRDTYYSSLEIGRHVLEAIGYDEQTAARNVATFSEFDNRLLQSQYLVYDDEAALLQSAREASADLERLFEADSGK